MIAREQKTFRVYVILPLLPAFEGDVGGATGELRTFNSVQTKIISSSYPLQEHPSEL